jgi:hypothetical protein
MFQHLSADVPSDAHYRLVALAALRQFRDCLMSEVVKSQALKTGSFG